MILLKLAKVAMQFFVTVSYYVRDVLPV